MGSSPPLALLSPFPVSLLVSLPGVPSRESQKDNLQHCHLLWLQLSENMAALPVREVMQGKDDLGFVFLTLHPSPYPFLP